MKYLLWFSTILLTATYICGPIIDPDLWWHIVIGRWIIAHQEFPVDEIWNRFALGQPFIAYSWLFEIIVAKFETAFGIKGLFSFKFFLATLLVFSLSYIFGKLTRDWTLGLLFGVFASLACFAHLTLRPQLIVWILFAWLLYFSNNFNTRDIKFLDKLLILFIACLWSNIHLTQFIVILTILFWTFDKSNWQKSLTLCLWAVLGTLITPYIGQEWLVFFSKTDHPFSYAAIAEFRPATIMDYSVSFLVMAGVLLMALLNKNWRVLNVSQYLLLMGLTLAALAVVKFLPFAVIGIMFAVSKSWPQVIDNKQNNNLQEGLNRLTLLINKIPEQGLTFLILVLAFITIRPNWQRPVDVNLVPKYALDFMLNNDLPHNWLHEFGQGGYVMYRLSDSKGIVSKPVAIDGRTNVNPPKVWQAYMAAMQGGENWQDFVTMANPGTILWRKGSPFITLLKQSGQWCEVYRSGDNIDSYVILVQKARVSESGLPESEASCL